MVDKKTKRLGYLSTMSTATQDLKTRFGQRLERARLMRGLSLRGLSEALGGLVSYNAIAKYE
jgi:ribosome-binding protein aMBF1 (putative translation factor)